MKHSIFKRAMSGFLALILFLTAFPLTAFAATTDSGQIKISNGSKYSNKWDYIYFDSSHKIPTYFKAATNGSSIKGNGTAGDTYTNVLKKYVSGTGSATGSNQGGAKTEYVPIFRVSRDGGYTTPDNGSYGVSVVDVSDPSKFYAAAVAQGIDISLTQARNIAFVLQNGFKQFTSTSGTNYYAQQMSDLATQCIIWEIQEGKRTNFNYSKSSTSYWCRYWYDYIYNSSYYPDSAPDYYKLLVNACDSAKADTTPAVTCKSVSTTLPSATSSITSDQCFTMNWSNSNNRYECTMSVDSDFIGTTIGTYNPQSIVLPISSTNVTLNYSTYIYTQPVSNTKIKYTTSGSSKKSVTVKGVTKSGYYYISYTDNNTGNTGAGYVKKSDTSNTGLSSTINMTVSSNKITFYSTKSNTSNVTIKWNKYVAQGYNSSYYFNSSDSNAIRGYVCGGNQDSLAVFFKLNTTGQNTVTWKNSYNDATIKEQTYAYGQTLSKPVNPSSFTVKTSTQIITYTFSHWATTKNGTSAASLPSAVTSNATYWAVWKTTAKNIQYTVNFVCDYCKQTINTSTVNAGSSVTAPGSDLLHDHTGSSSDGVYEFKEWQNESGKSAGFNSGDKLTPSADVTYYAHYIQIEPSVAKGDVLVYVKGLNSANYTQWDSTLTEITRFGILTVSTQTHGSSAATKDTMSLKAQNIMSLTWDSDLFTWYGLGIYRNKFDCNISLTGSVKDDYYISKINGSYVSASNTYTHSFYKYKNGRATVTAEVEPINADKTVTIRYIDKNTGESLKNNTVVNVKRLDKYSDYNISQYTDDFYAGDTLYNYVSYTNAVDGYVTASGSKLNYDSYIYGNAVLTLYFASPVITIKYMDCVSGAEIGSAVLQNIGINTSVDISQFALTKYSVGDIDYAFYYWHTALDWNGYSKTNANVSLMPKVDVGTGDVTFYLFYNDATNFKVTVNYYNGYMRGVNSPVPDHAYNTEIVATGTYDYVVGDTINFTFVNDTGENVNTDTSSDDNDDINYDDEDITNDGAGVVEQSRDLTPIINLSEVIDYSVESLAVNGVLDSSKVTYTIDELTGNVTIDVDLISYATVDIKYVFYDQEKKTFEDITNQMYDMPKYVKSSALGSGSTVWSSYSGTYDFHFGLLTNEDMASYGYENVYMYGMTLDGKSYTPASVNRLTYDENLKTDVIQTAGSSRQVYFVKDSTLTVYFSRAASQVKIHYLDEDGNQVKLKSGSAVPSKSFTTWKGTWLNLDSYVSSIAGDLNARYYMKNGGQYYTDSRFATTVTASYIAKDNTGYHYWHQVTDDTVDIYVKLDIYTLGPVRFYDKVSGYNSNGLIGAYSSNYGEEKLTLDYGKWDGNGYEAIGNNYYIYDHAYYIDGSTFNYGLNTVGYSVYYYKADAGSAETGQSILSKSYSSYDIQSMSDVVVDTRECRITPIYQSTHLIKYVDENGKDIKESVSNVYTYQGSGSKTYSFTNAPSIANYTISSLSIDYGTHSVDVTGSKVIQPYQSAIITYTYERNTPIGIDLGINFITPNSNYVYGQDVVSTFQIYNHTANDFTVSAPLTVNAYLLYDINGVTYRVQIDSNNKVIVPAHASNICYFKWTVPTASELIGNAGASSGATISNFRVFADAYITGNSALGYCSCEEEVVVSNDFKSDTAKPEYSLDGGGYFNYKAPSDENTEYYNIANWEQYTWNETAKDFVLITYKIKLSNGSVTLYPDSTNASASAVFGNDNKFMHYTSKSGYAFNLRLKTTTSKQAYLEDNGNLVATGLYSIGSNAYTDVQSAKALYPEFSYSTEKNKCSMLERIGTDVFEFVKNTASTDNGRKHFTPMWFPDTSTLQDNGFGFDEAVYRAQVYSYNCWTPAGMLSYLDTSNGIVINGSLWDDYYTSEQQGSEIKGE